MIRAFLTEFFGLFRDMPNRASGGPLEAKATQILSSVCASSFGARVEPQPFAVDISSGAWNVALHGVLLGLILVASLGGGFVVALCWGPGPLAATLGPFGPLPLAALLCAALSCLAFLASRIVCSRTGWSIFSFFLPNSDSANVLVSNLPPPPRLQPKDKPIDAWRSRLAASGAKRLVAVVAHYDSARCLPPRKRMFIDGALKNGIGVLPTVAYALMFACLSLESLAGIFGFSQVLSGSWLGWLVLAIFVLSFAMALIEAAVSAESSILPYCPGYNDNLSGSAAIAGALSMLFGPGDRSRARYLPEHRLPESKGAELKDTAFLAAFTGSEENGLHGGFMLAETAIAAAVERFGPDFVYVINLDTISGPNIYLWSSEKSFSGSLRGGNPEFAKAAHGFLSGNIVSPTEVATYFTQAEQSLFLKPSGSGFGFAFELGRHPIPSYTDISAICSSPRMNGKAKTFAVTSPQDREDDPNADPLLRPRDYHMLSDNYEALMDHSAPANFGAVVALSLAIAKLVKAIAAGTFER